MMMSILKANIFPHFHYSSKILDSISQEAATAMMMSLFEMSRRKKGFISGLEEQLDYAALFYYPIYIYPWKNKKCS